MRVTDAIKKGEKFFSIEISPPYKFKSIQPIFKVVERLLPYRPAFVNVTYHPLKITKIAVNHTHNPEFIEKKHVNSIALCATIMYKYDVNVVPHFVCAGLNKVQVEDALFDFSFLGIENVLALRGDPATTNEVFKPADGGYSHANELVEQINAMKRSVFMNKEDDYNVVDFCIGVAGYPEKHVDAVDLDTDIDNLKRKVDSGADYIITQICYDMGNFESWLEKVQKAGIDTPIIPGVKPLTSVSQLLTLRNVYGINVPKVLEKRLLAGQKSSQTWSIGVEHGIELSNQLLAFGVPGLHYFTMGNGKDIEEVVKSVFPQSFCEK
jgi:methylenetetrahydrofolate reductase (NADPH)